MTNYPYPSPYIRNPAQAQVGVTPISTPAVSAEPLTGLFVLAAMVYLGIYALEAPVRYVLFLAGKDSLIFVRDILIFGPLALLLGAQVLRYRVHPAFLIAGALFVFHGLILVGNVGSLSGAVYGVKMLINVLFGFFIAASLIYPGEKTLKVLFAIWLVTLIGVCLDKFMVTMPWTGITTYINNLTVDVSRGWDIDDPLARRVAGFARSSISVAILMPLLTIVLLTRIRQQYIRAIMALLALTAVFLTTQKGSFIAFAPIAAALFLAPHLRLKAMRLLCVIFMILAAFIPLATIGLHLGHGSGVFSTESLYLRVSYTWPQAWDWIRHHELPMFGVGLGGIGGPQRLYAPDNFNPADNIFVLMYAYFGVFAFVYILFAGYLAFRRITGSSDRVVTATAIVAFTFGYGAVLSMLEDQSAPLFLGAAIGVLWQETRRIYTMAAPPVWQVKTPPRRAALPA